MPISDLKDRNDRDFTGTMLKFLYCPDCGHYSGGGVCRLCETGLGPFTPPSTDSEPFVAILCSRGQGCEVVSLPAAHSAAEAGEKRQEALL